MYKIKTAVAIDAISYYDKIVCYVLPGEHKSPDRGIFIRVH